MKETHTSLGSAKLEEQLPFPSKMKFLSAIVLTAISCVTSLPAIAQTYVCGQVSDPDGWVNVRSVTTGEVVGRFPNGTEFYIDHISSNRETSYEYVILFKSPGLMVHNSRVNEVRFNNSCKRHYLVTDPDGWTNVRGEPGGRVLTTVDAGSYVLAIGETAPTITSSNYDGWLHVVTPDGTFGFIHGSRLRGPFHNF